uniref:Uncharacterized protein n=1 Tax=Anguilla anguilla TaxID=7936 RepID=A0A0E9V1M3_ANGAN
MPIWTWECYILHSLGSCNNLGLLLPIQYPNVPRRALAQPWMVQVTRAN